jgi:hypothetical protein
MFVGGGDILEKSPELSIRKRRVPLIGPVVPSVLDLIL